MPKIPFWVFIVLAVIHFTAVRVDVMDVDASQYAHMSRDMMESGNYLHLYDRGNDYLDKPPFLFWVSALSMKVFGVSNFAYKLPSILFALWAMFATYRLARLLYDEQAARMAAFILGCCQGMFLMTNDIRTDTILMSWTITAIWLIKEWDVKRRLHYLLLGSAAIAFGMMTKGPIAVMVPVFCFVTDWILKREWKKFFHPAYLLSLLVIVVLLIPMSIGLYQQYDMHPEKVMDGNTGTSGLKFFFWTQSFGRITGENTWDNGAPFSFLFENMLWSFLPWILLFVIAMILNVKELVTQKLRLNAQQEWLTTGGFILAYLALGSSSYQLPHYIFVVFPLAAIMVAKLLKDFFEGKYTSLYRILKPVQIVISVLLLVAALLTFVYVFEAALWTYFVWTAAVIIWLWAMLKKEVSGKIFWSGAMAIIIANIFMTNHFYFELLKYQAGSRLGRLIYQQNIPAENITIVNMNDALEAMHFYAQRPIKNRVDTLQQITSGNYLVTSDDYFATLQKKGIAVDIIDRGAYYKVSELTPEFINPATRAKSLKQYYFLRIK
ncbi:MAG TPA: glycosyltransferase family 39 protein [Flavipsychrobacter sp.]|nr:glycosyltransferase family 39 protein [Flavipsychrobacter sp.]